PLIAPAIAAGFVLAFTLSLDDLIIANFTTGPGATTLPIRIYSEVRLGVKPEINAVCTIVIAVVAAAIVVASLVTKLSGARQRAGGPAGSGGVSVSGAGGRPRDGRAGGQPRFICVDRETITPAPVLPYGPAG